MSKKSRYPRTVYRKDENGTLSFTNKTHRSLRYDSLNVNNEEELAEAEKMGYVDNFSDALFGPPAKTEPIDEEY